MSNISNVKKLGERLHEARRALGLSAREVGEQIGAHHSTVIALERGTIDQPRPQNLQRLAKVLQLDASDLLTLAGYQPSDRLPSFPVYLRATTGLPDAAIDELRGHFEYLQTKYDIDLEGPLAGADE